VPIVRLQRFEQSRLRWIYRLLRKLPGLGTDRIAARLHCHASDERPLIYNIIKCSIGQDAFWCRCYSIEGWPWSAAELNSLGIQINAPTILPLFRHVFPLFPSSTLSFFHVSLYSCFFCRWISLQCVSQPGMYPRMSLHLCMSAYNSWSVSRCIHVCAFLHRLQYALCRPEVTDRACSREEYLEKWQRDREKIDVEVDEMYTKYIFRLDCGSNSGNLF